MTGDAISPYVEKTLCWFLKRWAASYMMPSPSLYERVIPSLEGTYGSESQRALQILDSIVHKATLNVVYWGSEVDLAEQSCDLLRFLASNSQVSGM